MKNQREESDPSKRKRMFPHTHLAEVEFQTTHKPLDGFYLLWRTQSVRLTLVSFPFPTVSTPCETYLVQLIQRPLQHKQD